MKKFQFRYQTIKGEPLMPSFTEDEKTAFEQKCTAMAESIFDRYNNGAYVLALLTDDGKKLLRGLIIA